MISARPSAPRTRRRRGAGRCRARRRRAGAEGGRSQAEEGSGAAAARPLPVRPAVFPNAVDPKYSKETAGKARMHTCVDQYNANKATNGNGGMKWIQKGGGYYSECNKKLKGPERLRSRLRPAGR